MGIFLKENKQTKKECGGGRDEIQKIISAIIIITTSVSCGCCNNLPQISRCKAAEMCPPVVLEVANHRECSGS